MTVPHWKLQYGHGIKAYVILLLIPQRISLRRVAEMVSSIAGRMISPDTMLGFILRLPLACAPWEERSQRPGMAMQSLHVDETSLRVDKKESLDSP